MGIREAWRISKTPYVEFTYRSMQLVRGPGQGGLVRPIDPSKVVKRIIRTGRINKITFTVLTSLMAGVLIMIGYMTRLTPSTLVGSVALSLTFSLAYLLVYLMQVLPSLPSGESYALLSTLPLSERDFSLVAVFSLVRTFDYLVVGTAVAQTAAIAYLTGSAAATALMLVASLMNSVFAISIAIWLSRQFYRNVTRGGRSRIGALMRLLFLVTWGLVVGGTFPYTSSSDLV